MKQALSLYSSSNGDCTGLHPHPLDLLEEPTTLRLTQVVGVDRSCGKFFALGNHPKRLRRPHDVEFPRRENF